MDAEQAVADYIREHLPGVPVYTSGADVTLVDFLTARLDEDEAAARRIHADRCDTPAEVTLDTMGRPMDPECDCDWHVARVLREVEAKRAIVALHADDVDEDPEYEASCYEDNNPWPCDTLRHLAAVYADHPSFREEWRV